ncbi:MAG: protein-glutamate O-methyltransferase [bacterium]
MDDQTFHKYAALIYAHSGINLGESKKELVRARLAKRMHALGIADYQDYYEYVVRDPKKEELFSLVDVISTNVTSFFREKDHFDFITSTTREWFRAGQRTFRFWSAGCSTGEEPFSLAITILEALGGERFLDAKILATDISRQVLNKARKGIYEKRKLANLPVQESKYFQPAGEDRVEVREFVRKMVVFNYLNLQGAEYPFRGPLDAIFCRNVMIYFDDQGRRKIIDRFHRLLKTSGYLMVGHSESLLGMAAGFRYVQPSIYQKV